MRNIFIIIFLFLIISCAQIPLNYYPPNYIAVDNSIKKCASNFIANNLFTNNDLIAITYLNKNNINNLAVLYEKIKNMFVSMLTNNNVAIVDAQGFTNSDEILFNKLLENNVNKLIVFDICISGVKFEKYSEAKSVFSKKIFYNRIAYTKLFITVVDTKTKIVLYSNFVDGTYIDSVPKNAMKTIKETDYLYYENKINKYKTKEELKMEKQQKK